MQIGYKNLNGLQATAGEIDGAINNMPLINNRPISGSYMITPMHANSGQIATQTNTQVVFVPIWFAKPISINALIFKVSGTANAGEKAVIGIYKESSNGMIGELIDKSAEITLTASTYTTYEGAIAQRTLPAGKYWLALDRNGTTATMYGCIPAISSLLWASMSYSSAVTIMAGRNSFPAYTYTYDGNLPSNLTSKDLQLSTDFGVVAYAPTLGVKVA